MRRSRLLALALIFIAIAGYWGTSKAVAADTGGLTTVTSLDVAKRAVGIRVRMDSGRICTMLVTSGGVVQNEIDRYEPAASGEIDWWKLRTLEPPS